MGAFLYFLAVVIAVIVGDWAAVADVACDWQFTVGAMFTIVLLFISGLVNAYFDPSLLEKDDDKGDDKSE